MRRLAIVKSGWPLMLRLFAYRTFAAQGWRVAVLDGVLNQGLRVGDVPIVCDLSDTNSAAPQLRERFGAPDGVLTFNDSGLVYAARLAEAFGLSFLAPDVAARSVDKRWQRQAFAKFGLRVPHWTELSGPTDAQNAIRKWGAAVIKPIDRAAGAGVRLAQNRQEAAEAFQEAVLESHSGRALAEEWLEGPEVSIESVVVEGRHHAVCVTDKAITEGPRFIEVGHTVPSGLPKQQQGLLAEAALGACESLDLSWGAAHTEVKWTDRGPVVIEVNPRLAGDCIVDLVDLALGVNLYEQAGRQAFGERLHLDDLSPRNNRAASIRFQLSTPGTLLGVQSPLERSPPDWLVELSVVAPLGSRLREPASNADRIGYAIAVADSPKEASLRARSALESLQSRIEMEPWNSASG